MEKSVLYNSNWEFEYQQWKKEITIWKENLKTFTMRLSEFITRWGSKRVLDQMGDYQKFFIFHSGVIEELSEALERQKELIMAQSDSGKIKQDVDLVKVHKDFRSRMEIQREIYAELKKNVFRFRKVFMAFYPLSS